MGLLTVLWRTLWRLIADLASSSRRVQDGDGDEQAQDDDLLDACLDDDGVDATGL